MTIKSDKSKVTLDFECDVGEQEYQVKFHYTDDFGQTISLSEDGEAYTGYPAKLFSEIVDFLRSQNVLDEDVGAVPNVAKSAPVVAAAAVPMTPHTPLPVPKISVDTSVQAPVVIPTAAATIQPSGFDQPVMNVEPVQSFTGGASQPVVSNPVVKQSEENSVNNAVEDANSPEILAERNAALKKSNNAKAIKRAAESEEE